MSAGHPFYSRQNTLLDTEQFDVFVEALCRQYYAAKMGRPGFTRGIYFRCLLVGYFEGIDSERAEWTKPGSLNDFLSTRRLISLETHEPVFGYVLHLIATRGLLKGQTVGIDATGNHRNIRR